MSRNLDFFPVSVSPWVGVWGSNFILSKHPTHSNIPEPSPAFSFSEFPHLQALVCALLKKEWEAQGGEEIGAGWLSGISWSHTEGPWAAGTVGVLHGDCWGKHQLSLQRGL